MGFAAGVKLDMESLSSRLDILQGFVERQQRTAEEKGWQAGRSGDRRGEDRRGDSRGTAAAASSVPDSDEVLNSVQGLSHSGVMLSQMRGALLSFTSSLKGILHVRSGALKAQAERRAAFGGGGRELGRPVSMASVARPDHSDAIVHVGEHHRGSQSDGGEHAPFAQLSQQQLTAVNDNSYLEARAADVRLIEGHMTDLAQMFTRLASVVSEQGAMVERIEDNLTTSERDLESGLGELHRWKERVFSNRNLALRVVSILILFIFLFVIFGT
jgi:syntaxin 5